MILARSREALEDVRDESPSQVRILSGDMSDFSLGQKAVDLAVKEFGGLDGLIVNHGTLGRSARAHSSLIGVCSLGRTEISHNVSRSPGANPEIMCRSSGEDREQRPRGMETIVRREPFQRCGICKQLCVKQETKLC